MPLREYVRKTSHREHLVWVAWLDRQWNEPDRHDWYLMQVACEIRRVLHKSPNSVEPKQFKIPFKLILGGAAEGEGYRVTPEHAAAVARVRHKAILGENVTYKTRPAPLQPITMEEAMKLRR